MITTGLEDEIYAWNLSFFKTDEIFGLWSWTSQSVDGAGAIDVIGVSDRSDTATMLPIVSTGEREDEKQTEFMGTDSGNVYRL